MTFAQAFEKVYTDRANSDLAIAERRNAGIYEANRELDDLQTLVKHDRALQKAGRARLDPDNLGDFATGASMTPGLRSGYPSVNEVLRLVDGERKKGFSRERAFDVVAARMLRVGAAGKLRLSLFRNVARGRTRLSLCGSLRPLLQVSRRLTVVAAAVMSRHRANKSG